MLIKACLNGATKRAEHPAVPLSPGELATEARAAVDAGAGALHLHPRDAAGDESLAVDDVQAALSAVRAACPGIPVGVSTGLWMADGDPERRLALIQGWGSTDPPDFASVNLSETGPEAVAAALGAVGIGVEAGVWTADDARRLGDLGFASGLVRVLVEPQDEDPQDAVATANAVEEALDACGIRGPRLHHGYGRATWAVLRAAIERGRDIRVGLEDTTERPDGRRAAGNADLVAAAAALLPSPPPA